MNKTPTAEQLKALQIYAAQHGRNWKSALWNEWMNGTVDDPELQIIRNTFGPTWLTKFRLPKG